MTNPVLEGRLDDAVPVEFKVGGDPVGGPIKKTVADNMLVVGDAARITSYNVCYTKLLRMLE